MPIKATEIIYTNLINETLQKIKDVCVNIDSFSPEIPDELKNGTKFLITNLQGLENTYKLYGTTVDNITKVVSSNTVENQFRSFLANRNLTSKYTTNYVEKISLKSITHWYNNISAFLAVRLKLINDSFGHGPCIFYDDNSSLSYQNIDYVKSFPVNEDFSIQDIDTAIKCLLNDSMSIENTHLLSTILKYNIS